MVLGAASSSRTKSRSSWVGMFVRLFLCLTDETGVFFAGGLGFRGTSALLASAEVPPASSAAGRLGDAHGAANHVLRVPRVCDLDERPAAKAAVSIDGRHPKRAGRGDLGLLILLAL